MREHQAERVRHWDEIARSSRAGATWSAYYHRRIRDLYRFRVPAGQRVLELGCGQGDLLAALDPAYGVGLDFLTGNAGARTGLASGTELRARRCARVRLLNETFDVVITFRPSPPPPPPGTLSECCIGAGVCEAD